MPVHLEGTLRKVLPHAKVSEVFTPKGRLMEAWFFTPESQRLPYVVMVEDFPPGLPIGENLGEPVVVDAYFLKLLRYKAGDTDRAAPLLVGRLRWKPRDSGPGMPAPGAGGKNSWNLTIILVVVALVVYVAFRLLAQVRRVTTPLRRPDLRSLDRPTEEIAPEALADWLAVGPRRGRRGNSPQLNVRSRGPRSVAPTAERGDEAPAKSVARARCTVGNLSYISYISNPADSTWPEICCDACPVGCCRPS